MFTTVLYHEAGVDKQLSLSDVCQQGITLVDAQGATAYKQTTPSCL